MFLYNNYFQEGGGDLKKSLYTVIAVLLVVLIFTACGTTPMKSKELQNTPKVDVPGPEVAEIKSAEAAPKGDKVSTQLVNIPLYYVNKDKTKFVTQVKQVVMSQDQTLEEVTINALLTIPDNPELQTLIPEGTVVEQIELSENIATVCLNSKYKEVQEDDEIIARYQIVNTLTELENIDYVSILVDNQELGFKGTPTGPMTKFAGDIQELLAEKKSVAQPKEAAVENKDLTLYFQDPLAQYLLPEIRNVPISGKGYITAIIEELKKGPQDDSSLKPVLPKDLKLVESPKVEELESGKRCVTLNFSNALMPIIQAGTTSEALALGSIVNSICGFIPDIEYVKILIEGQSIENITGHLSIPDGKLYRKNFENWLGKRLTLYFPNRDSSALIAVQRAVPASDMRYARMILEELLKGPEEVENPDARPIISKDVNGKDIIGISLEGDLIKLNLSSNFQTHAQGLGSAGESMLLFSIVNSLTELRNVKKVQFFIEGQTIETLSGHISLKEPLIRNPGIIKKK